jgi:hypothetical protein
MNIAVKAAVTSKHKRTLLPMLVILFLISYCLLTMLVVEQNRTIDSQRTLIHLLFKDNLQLSSLRKAERQKSKAHASQGTTVGSMQSHAQSPSAKIPVIQVPSEKGPSTETPSNQVQAEKVQSGKATAQNGAKTQRRAGKAKQSAPSRPPAELTDPSDMRRVWSTI